jgi:phosphoribosylamine---glycine ligase
MALTPKIQLLAIDPTNARVIIRMSNDLKIDLVIVGPERPLALGVVDVLQNAGVTVLGPTQAAAQLESSKIFAKKFMQEFGIPTARFSCSNDYIKAKESLEEWPGGVVIKADGLCQGKGVMVANTRQEAEDALNNLMCNPNYPVKAQKIILEEKLQGKEVSAFALCDGERFITLGFACDYKRAYDWDQGPNTGGMGSYVPTDWPNPEQREWIEKNIFTKVLEGCKKRGMPYQGILFAGLMIDGEKINVLEFNVRLGDPETQSLLPLIQTDLSHYFLAAAHGNLEGFPPVKYREGTAVHVVMASGGYPGNQMELGKVIHYPDHLYQTDTNLYFAGVSKDEFGVIKNSGGRVLGITALGKNVEEARQRVYAALGHVQVEKSFWRSDIGL